MTSFQVLTLVLACIAIVVSVYTLSEQRKLQKESNKLQRVTADLAARQMKEMEEQEKQRNKTRLGVDLYSDRSVHRLRVSNLGSCDAFDVRLAIADRPPLRSMINANELAQKFPVKRINPGNWVTLFCSVGLDSPPSLDGVVSWKNPDGTDSQEEFTVFTS
jgi:hypothetical protein